jgi:membrane dipeptidase
MANSFIIDGHLDLAMNAMEWNRDLRAEVPEIREREKGLTDKHDRGNGLVSLPALRRGKIGLVVATQIGRYVAPGSVSKGWHSPAQAWAQTQAQLAWYKAMEAGGEMVQVNPNDEKPVGYILSLEGADSLITVEHLERAHAYGLRALGPGHYGPGRYANGTNATGKMNTNGIALLKKMEALNIILDATHLCDDAFWQAMDNFNGSVWASHNNCRAIVNHNRQFSDEQITTLIARGAVIGAGMDASMIVPGWVHRQSTPQQMNCNLDRLIDHMDHICQLAGNSLHIGMGSDLDGAYGKEQCPYDIDTIEDLQKMPWLLSKRGYSTGDIENVMHGNWMRFLQKAWS